MSRAQEEHDAFAEALRERGVEVLYLTELLIETLERGRPGRMRSSRVTSSLHLGDTLRDYLAPALRDLARGA